MQEYNEGRFGIAGAIRGGAIVALVIGALALLLLMPQSSNAASVDRYTSESRMTRVLLECGIDEVDPAATGWCDTAVDFSTDWRGELYYSPWGASLSVHACWAGTHYDCLDIQSEMDFRYVAVGTDNVATFIRAYDFYTSEDRYFHILNWTVDQQQIVGMLEDGRRYILVFEQAPTARAYLWSD